MMMATWSAGACSSKSSSIDGAEVGLMIFGSPRGSKTHGREPSIVSRRLAPAKARAAGRTSSAPRIEITNDDAQDLAGEAGVASDGDGVGSEHAGIVEEIAI